MAAALFARMPTGSVVSFMLPNWHEAAVLYLAATLAGMVVNPILLGCYTLGCHSLRHLVGGRIDEMSKSPVRKQSYDCVTCLNKKHMMWAWFSLFWVGFTDLYVRLCSMGVIKDWRLL